MYASVMFRKTVKIALMTVTLNDLEVKMGEILNAYVHTPATKTLWTTLGPEFGKDSGKTAVIVRYLNGLNSPREAFRRYLAKCKESMGYESCKADLDLLS